MKYNQPSGYGFASKNRDIWNKALGTLSPKQQEFFHALHKDEVNAFAKRVETIKRLANEGDLRARVILKTVIKLKLLT